VVSEPAPDLRPLAAPTKQVENDRFIVTEWRFAPGAHTGWHRHAFDYVVVPMTTGRLTIETAIGTTPAELVAGNAYARQAGVEHDVINDNPHEFVFIEIEAKG
jgi:beta-alanine degradation protein BauB